MLRKLASICVAGAMLLQAPLASAADLNSAFNNLLIPGSAASVTSPGRYQSAARNTFVAGGLEMRIPKQENSPQMFSFTPPRISAGCNGVSAYFGGFSFISGAEFEQLVKSIASGAALGFVTMLTMKTLCPQCADVVQQLKNAAQIASRLAIDSCKLGQEAAKAFMGEQNNFQSELCGSTVSSEGASSDFLSAINNSCNSIAGSVKSLIETNPSANEGSEKGKSELANLRCKTGSGNVTWVSLGGSGQRYGSLSDMPYGRKVLLMNMMGAVLRHGDKEASCETPTGTKTTAELAGEDQIYCSPMVNAKDIAGAFMCGTDVNALNKTGSQAAVSYCSQFFGTGSSQHGTASLSGVTAAKLMVCDDPTLCMNLKLKPFGESGIGAGEGFLVQVTNTLQKAVHQVRNNQKLSEDVIALMQAAPYPLYQAVNAAAVYPVAAADLLDSISILVAESVTANYMEEFLRWEGKDSTGNCTSQEQARRILDTLASAKAEIKNRRDLVAQNMAVQQGLREQIRMVNLAIQQQVMTTDLLHQNQMAESLTRAVAPGNSGPSPVGGGAISQSN
ncbi:Conjugative relaxosome accessory transposon protein [compost metagenome]